MSPHTKPATTLALFCKVVDNFGDIGICWRLARQLRAEHGVAVTLWVDDLASFRRICPAVDVQAEAQTVEGVGVRHWAGQDGTFGPEDIADIVIEFFAVDIPPAYVAAMAQCTPRPVWLNLEGLTAEEWVEGCHRLPSSHPRLPLTKHFFFPGFTPQTGGLIKEAALDTERLRFRSDPAAMGAFLAALGVAPAEMDALKVSLFCYPHAPVAELLRVWQDAPAPVLCLVPEGVAAEAAGAFFALDAGATARAGAAVTRGALTLRVLPFVPQADYDRLLWACDINFVRGEDSFVRAQWAGRPFIWHIYPQDENLHHKKLRAFLQRYCGREPGGMASLQTFSLAWNGAAAGTPDWPALWAAIRADEAGIVANTADWQAKMGVNGDMAANLLRFAVSLR